MQTFFDFMLLFFTYSCIGWICECIYCSVPQKRFVNRGFLTGPLCPVYGFGALLVLFLLEPLFDYPIAVFFLGILLTSVLEYITAVILESLFHMKWWDYSTKRFNIHGRVCLLNSILFGFLSIALVYVIHPPIIHIIEGLSMQTVLVLGSSLTTLLIVDLTLSIRSTLLLHGKLPEISKILSGIVEKNRVLMEKNRALLESKFFQRRLLGAFPHLHSERYRGAVEKLREIISEHKTQQK